MSVVRQSYFSTTLNPQQHENLEDITIVWFDTTVHVSDDCIDFQSRIRHIINYLIVFDDCITCENYLLSIETEKVFLIVSGTDGESLVTAVRHLSKIHSIYIFCFDKPRHEEWTKNYTEIRGVYENKDELLKKLREDALNCLSELLPMRALSPKAIQKTIKELNEESGSFVWSHFLIHILRNMHHDENAKKELLTLSRQQYIGNDEELAKIYDFEMNYTADKSIWWYTKDLFLYRLLNKALRTENFDVIYKFRSFIADLHQQLKSMHPNYIDQKFSSGNEQTFSVYRGQHLPIIEFEKIKQNINGFISMNTFLSTTLRSNVALIYSGNGEDRPLFESVLFEIEIEKSYITEPFADICQVSFFKNEDEILFTIGSIFRIDSIDDLTPTISLIKLSLVKHSDEDIGRLTQYLNDSIHSEPTLKDLNDIFLHIDDYQRVVRFSQILLDEPSITDADRATTYLTLGEAELHINGDCIKAEKLFLDAQKIALHASPCNYYILALSHGSIGLLEIEKSNYTASLESFNTVLQIALDHSLELDIIIRGHVNLGLAYRKELDFDRACENYEKALDIIKQWNKIPKLHSFNAVIHNNLAFTKQLQYCYDDALKHYNIALEIERKSLPPNHSIIATTLNNIALLHMMKDEDEQAMIIYEKVLIMLNEIYGHEHPRLGTIYNNLGDLYLKKGQNEQAKEYLMKALHIRLNNDGIDPNDLASTYTSLGSAHCRLQSFDSSLEFCLKALNIRLTIPETKINNISDTYLVLVRYYTAKFDYHEALRNCELAERRCQSQSIKLAGVHEAFGDILNRIGLLNDAISHYQKSIDIQLQLTNRNNIRLASSYHAMGIIYGCDRKSDEALRCFAHVRELVPENSILIVESHMATAEIYVELKQFDKAIEDLDQAKRISDKIVPKNHLHTAARLRAVGILHLKKNEFHIAVKNLTDALAIYEKELMEFHPTVCDTYLKLGLTLQKQNKTDEALQVFEKVKTMTSNLYSKTHSLIPACYHRISIILRDKNLLDESLNNAEHALASAMIAKPTNYHELSRIHDTLSSIHLIRGDFSRARIEVQNGSIVRQTYCPNDLALSQIYLASICIHEKCTQEAIDLLNGITDDQLLSVHNYTPSRLSKDIAIIYNDLQHYESALRMIEFALNHIADDEHYLGADAHFLAAKICWTLGRKCETIEHFNHALIMLDDTTNECYREMITYIYKNMTKIYKSLNEYDQALECYQKMLTACKTEELAQIHLDIGICFTELKQLELSLENYQLAYSLCSPTNYDLLTSIHYELGRYYTRVENSIEALKHFETSLDMRSLCMKSDDDQLDSLYQDMGQLYLESEKYQEAAKIFEQLVERQLQQDDQQNAVNTLVLLGLTQVRQENVSKAIHYYQLGLKLSLNMSSPDYKIAAHIYSHLGETYDVDCNVWKRAESYEKALEMASMVEPHDDEFLAFFLENVQVAREDVTKIENMIPETEKAGTDKHD